MAALTDTMHAAFDRGAYDRAIQYADRLITLYPLDYVAFTIKGAALGGLDRNEEGITQLTQAIRIKPTYTNAYYWRGRVYNKMGDHENAIRDIETVVLSEPEAVRFQAMLAQYHVAAGQFAAAIDQFTNLLRQDSALVGERRVMVLNARAEAKYRIGDVGGAHADVDTALALGLPGRPMYYTRLTRGDIYLREDQPAEALAAIEAAIAVRPDSVSDERIAIDFNNRGYAHLMLGNTDQARKDINRASMLYPKNAYVYRNRALVYLKHDKHTEACDDIQHAMDLDYANQFGYAGRYGPPPGELYERHCTAPASENE